MILTSLSASHKIIKQMSSIIGFWTQDCVYCIKTHKLSITAAAAKSLQPCPTLCDPTDGSPPGSPVPGILQARTLDWAAISFSNAWKWKVKGKSLSLSESQRPRGLQPTRLHRPWDFRQQWFPNIFIKNFNHQNKFWECTMSVYKCIHNL